MGEREGAAGERERGREEGEGQRQAGHLRAVKAQDAQFKVYADVCDVGVKGPWNWGHERAMGPPAWCSTTCPQQEGPGSSPAA